MRRLCVRRPRAGSALISSVALISYGNANAGFPQLAQTCLDKYSSPTFQTHSRLRVGQSPKEPRHDAPQPSPVHALPRTVRAPRGTSLTCKNWLIEAAYRMVQNNLDPEVAENPDALVVYGGIGKGRATGIASRRS